MTDEPPGQPALPTPPRHYTNWIQTQWGLTDLAIDFGYRVRPAEPLWLVGVSMSWEEALIFRQLLTTAITAYEENVGPIRDVEGVGPIENEIMSQNGGGEAHGDPHDADDADDEEDPDDADPGS